MLRSLLIASILLATTSAFADGKAYVRERVPPDIPFQRALILFDQGRETLVLQSAVDASALENPDATLGWVVPVPSDPEVSSLPTSQSYRLFRSLDFVSWPSVIVISDFVLPLVILSPAILGLLVLILGLGSRVVPALRPLDERIRRIGSRRVRMATLIAFFFGVIAIGLLLPALSKAGGAGGVEVLRSEQVGIFDVTVLRAERSDDLIAWLNDNHFQSSEGDRAALDDYISKGWLFITAMVRADTDRDRSSESERLFDPLVVRFAAPEPIYPLALTATIGSDTEVLIYLLARNRYDCAGRLECRFAGPLAANNSLRNWYEPLEAHLPEVATLDYLCKFKGRLSAAEMQQDLVFTKVSNGTPLRERVIRW